MAVGYLVPMRAFSIAFSKRRFYFPSYDPYLESFLSSDQNLRYFFFPLLFLYLVTHSLPFLGTTHSLPWNQALEAAAILFTEKCHIKTFGYAVYFLIYSYMCFVVL